jgi:prolyl-tRNA synthetase
LYAAAQRAGIDVLLDDRDERPGVMFAESELMGIPHRIVVGERSLKEGKLEYQGRRDAAATAVPIAGAIEFVTGKLCA